MNGPIVQMKFEKSIILNRLLWTCKDFCFNSLTTYYVSESSISVWEKYFYRLFFEMTICGLRNFLKSAAIIRISITFPQKLIREYGGAEKIWDIFDLLPLTCQYVNSNKFLYWNRNLRNILCINVIYGIASPNQKN